MEQARVFELLRRLGFFYVEDNVGSKYIEILAGHAPESLMHVVSLHVQDRQLTGPYAALLTRLDGALARYEDEADRAIGYAPEARNAWVSNLAKEAGLTIGQMQFFIQNNAL